MPWPKHLTVDKRIVLLLSASTYENFPRALREVVSNAYDADATRVTINVNRRNHFVQITDNGTGMTPDEFDLYLRIAGRQRSRARVTRLGRKRIGQFGIGFLAVFPFCKTLEVESTVEGSPVVFRAWIPASRFQADVEPREDITAANISGEEFVDESQRLSHYTKLTLVDTTELLDRYYQTADRASQRSRSLRSWAAADRLKWELSDILPLSPGPNSLLTEYVYPDPQDFSVSLNGETLLANDYVEEVLGHSGEHPETVGHVRFRYAIGTPWRAIAPDEARGLRIRLNHVGVGARTYFDLNIAGRTFSRLHWLTGDVNILEGLDESIALDRDNFTSTEDYDDLREFFRDKLRELAYYIEDVDEAKRKIAQQTSASPRATTESRRDVVQEQVERLRRRGFTVEEESNSPERRASSLPPVSINTATRTVTVRPSHPVLNDRLGTGSTERAVKFESWDFRTTALKACRYGEDGSIIFNQDYPLFKGAHQDIFRRLQVLLLEADDAAQSKEDYFARVQDMLLREFGSR